MESGRHAPAIAFHSELVSGGGEDEDGLAQHRQVSAAIGVLVRFAHDARIRAGTCSVLMTLPVTFAFNIGFMVAVGILLDTFVVRTIMVPAAVELLGERIWWPSTSRGGRHALREHAEAEDTAVPEPAR